MAVGESGPVDAGESEPMEAGEPGSVDAGQPGSVDAGESGPVDAGESGPVETGEAGVGAPAERGVGTAEVPTEEEPAGAAGEEGPANEGPAPSSEWAGETGGNAPDDVGAGDALTESGIRGPDAGTGQAGREAAPGESAPTGEEAGRGEVVDESADTIVGHGDGPVDADTGKPYETPADESTGAQAELAAGAGSHDAGEGGSVESADVGSDDAGTAEPASHADSAEEPREAGPADLTGAADIGGEPGEAGREEDAGHGSEAGESGPVDAELAGDGDVPEAAASPMDAAAPPESRRVWESAGENADFPPSMRDDLDELGQRLRGDVDPRAWANADRAERVSMLATANDTVREAYGLPAGDVDYPSDFPEGYDGLFDSQTGQVAMNPELLNESIPDTALETLAHENFHDYQQRAIDGTITEPYAESRREAWRLGSENYDSDDLSAYYTNPLEVDAFAAEGAVLSGYRRR